MKLIGVARLGKDVELRYTPAGKAVANLSLAYNYGQKGQDVNRLTQWVEASLWGKQAESLAPYLLKGVVFNVACRDVHIETFEGKNGTGHKLVGTIMDIEFVPKQAETKPAERAPAASAPKARTGGAPATGGAFDDFESDLPFASCYFSDDPILRKLRGMK